jgi:hypothetical protein
MRQQERLMSLYGTHQPNRQGLVLHIRAAPSIAYRKRRTACNCSLYAREVLFSDLGVILEILQQSRMVDLVQRSGA